MNKTLMFARILGILLVVTVFMFIVDAYSEPPPRCAIYLGDWQNYTYDVPCGQVHAWCDRNGCEKSSGNCGRPTCFCENITKGDSYTEYIYLEWQGFCDYCNWCYCLKGKDVSGNKRSLFFADEFKTHPEWERGDLLKVNWKFIPQINDYRVRGMERTVRE